MFADRVAMLEFANRGMQQVMQPDSHRRGNHFAILLLDPSLDVVVAFSLVCLQPEFAGNFHFRFHAEVIHFDRVPLLANFAERLGEIVAHQVPCKCSVFLAVVGAIAKHAVQILNALFQHAVGLTRIHLVRTRHVFEIH